MCFLFFVQFFLFSLFLFSWFSCQKKKDKKGTRLDATDVPRTRKMTTERTWTSTHSTTSPHRQWSGELSIAQAIFDARKSLGKSKNSSDSFSKQKRFQRKHSFSERMVNNSKRTRKFQNFTETLKNLLMCSFLMFSLFMLTLLPQHVAKSDKKDWATWGGEAEPVGFNGLCRRLTGRSC